MVSPKVLTRSLRQGCDKGDKYLLLGWTRLSVQYQLLGEWLQRKTRWSKQHKGRLQWSRQPKNKDMMMMSRSTCEKKIKITVFITICNERAIFKVRHNKFGSEEKSKLPNEPFHWIWHLWRYMHKRQPMTKSNSRIIFHWLLQRYRYQATHRVRYGRSNTTEDLSDNNLLDIWRTLNKWCCNCQV